MIVGRDKYEVVEFERDFLITAFWKKKQMLICVDKDEKASSESA